MSIKNESVPAPSALAEGKLSLSDMLFDVPGNWEAIFLAMRHCAVRAAMGVRFASGADRQDAIGDAVCHAMERLARYQPERRCAEAYFRRVLKRYMVKWAIRRPRELHDSSGSRDENTTRGSLLDAPNRALERRHFSEYQRFDSRLTCAADIRRAKRLIDRSLARSHEFLSGADGGENRARVSSVIDVLQELRKLMLGRYSRITADHARFRGTRRTETTEMDADDDETTDHTDMHGYRDVKHEGTKVHEG